MKRVIIASTILPLLGGCIPWVGQDAYGDACLVSQPLIMTSGQTDLICAGPNESRVKADQAKQGLAAPVTTQPPPYVPVADTSPPSWQDIHDQERMKENQRKMDDEIRRNNPVQRSITNERLSRPSYPIYQSQPQSITP